MTWWPSAACDCFSVQSLLSFSLPLSCSSHYKLTKICPKFWCLGTPNYFEGAKCLTNFINLSHHQTYVKIWKAQLSRHWQKKERMTSAFYNGLYPAQLANSHSKRCILYTGRLNHQKLEPNFSYYTLKEFQLLKLCQFQNIQLVHICQSMQYDQVQTHQFLFSLKQQALQLSYLSRCQQWIASFSLTVKTWRAEPVVLTQ